MGVPYVAEWVSRNSVTVRCNFESTDQVFRFLLTSDEHHDNRYSDHAMFKRHLDEMVSYNAGWISNGDLHCVMQGKWDLRSDQEQLRPEHRGNNYLDRVTDSVHEFLRPYAAHAILLGHGNHETNCINRHGVDMTERLCAKLYASDKSPVRSHTIAGWVQFRCYRSTVSETINMYRHHGYGFGAPVTKGVIQASRLSQQLPDAKVVVTGHNHAEWIFPIPRERVSTAGKQYIDEQLHVRIPGYLDIPTDAESNWAKVKGLAVTGTGAMWLEIYWDGYKKRFQTRVTRAK